MDQLPVIDYESIFQRVPVGMCISSGHVIRECNGALINMFGLGRASLVGQSLCRLYPAAADFNSIAAHITQTISATGCYADERIMKRNGEELFRCRIYGRAVQHDDPHASVIWIFEDLHDKSMVTAELTPREREIATLLITGKTSKVIAREIGLSPRTVDNHRSVLMRKFSAANSSELVHRLSMSAWRTVPA